ncbi:hypothetical protein D3C80_2144370 [compost metagenome]
MDFLSGRPGNPGGLADQHRRARDQWRTVEHVPRNGAEVVAVALGKVVFRFYVAGDGLFQYLRLFAFVRHAEQ